MMLSRFIRASLLGGAFAAGCSDSPTAATTVDTTGTTVNTTTSTCTSALSLAAGQVMTGLTGTSICVSGGAAGAEYALIPFFGTTTAAATTTLDFTETGTLSPSSAPSLIPSSGASLDVIGSALPLPTPAYHASHAYETAMHERERITLRPLIGAARVAQQRAKSSSRASFDAIPSNPVVGQILQLNANADSDCTAPDYRAARVVAITNTAIVVADTLNPAGGYSDAEYASFGATFDTLIDPLDRQAFGDPSDIDHNGHIVLFFTKAVNDLTPASSASYVGGFFHGRDLFPAKATTDFDACPSSNVGEMFYVMVPDPKRGGAFTKANVQSEVLGTLAHEYQHLINASRRMFVNTAATEFEETWLNEGLSHIAEELLFYRVSGLAPRQNISATTIRTSQALVDAFNDYASDNFGRYNSFLSSPSKYSVYADNDSLATRGATWAFLRDAADRKATSDGDTWFRLVNATTTGMTNLRAVFGTGVLNEIRDWGTSVLTDDMTGVDAAYQQPSWNFRSVFAALSNSTVFPISTLPLSTATQSVKLVGGATSYLRFRVASGSSASVQWNAPLPTVQFTLVRTK
jgi:hypothetical protein